MNRGVIGSLKERPIRLLLSAQSISIVGDNFATVAVAFAVLGLTGSASDLGLVLAARFVPLVAFMLVGGVTADRLPRRDVMIAANLVRWLSQGALAALVLVGQAHVWTLVVLAGIHGLASAFFYPALTAYVPEITPRRWLQDVNALFSLSAGFAAIAGPAVAGVVVVAFGAGSAIAVDSLTFLAGAALLARLPKRAPEPRGPQASLLRDAVAGWRELRRHTWIWASIAVSGLLQLGVLGPLFVLGPLIAERSLGGASAWGILLAATGIGGLLGGVAALRLRPRRLAFASAAWLLGLAPGFALLALPAPLWAIVLGRVFGGIALTLSMTYWVTALQVHVPPSSLSRIAAYDWMGSTALRPLGLALAGPLAAVAGVRTTLFLSAVMLVLMPLALMSLRSVRGLAGRGPDAELSGAVAAGAEPSAAVAA